MLFFPSHTTETDKRLILKTTINFFDKKVLPPFTAGFIFYQVTKKKIPLFKKISKTTEKRIIFYSPMSLLTFYSLFRVLNQQELINKKQVREQAPGAEVGEKIVYINENGERKDELPKNSIILFMPQENYETLIATKNAKGDCGHVKKRKAERHKASDENSDKEQ